MRIIVTGLIAQHPRLGGVTWDYIQYPLGLHQLGHDVYYFEDSGEWPYNTDGGPTGDDWVARDCSANIRHLDQTFRRFGLENRWAYRFPISGEWFGLPEQRRNEILASADLLINVSGTLEWPDRYRHVKRLVYIDSDPVFTQIKLALSQEYFSKRVGVHDTFFSFGESFSPATPASGYDWLPTRQPVVLKEWETLAPAGDAFTTVMSWTSYQPLQYQGRVYGQKDLELRRFLDLPRRVPQARLEVAMNATHHVNWESGEPAGHPADRLRAAGWWPVDADSVCGDIDNYRHFIQASKAEWSVAKNGYIEGQPGWFSCRSACYLAAGRPVVVQDTGFTRVLPSGDGIVAFQTLEEAAEGIREVEGRYGHHCRAAREIAREYFNSGKVLSHLIERALSGQNQAVWV